jgi:hypothetical protein
MSWLIQMSRYACHYYIFLSSLEYAHNEYRYKVSGVFWGAIHQLLNIIIQRRILVLLLVSTLPHYVKVKNYS